MRSSHGTKLWGLKVAPKFRNLLYTSVKDILPVRAALNRRRVDVEAECPLCGDNQETIAHLFLECRMVSPVWAAVSITINPAITGFATWLHDALKILNDATLIRLAATVWYIWNATNDEADSSKQNSLVRERGGRSSALSSGSVSKLRCFVDAALFRDQGLAGFGVVVLNENDLCVAAIAGLVRSPAVTILTMPS
nr:uncharacterized protein LOC109151968 [Ipomoea trifida]